MATEQKQQTGGLKEQLTILLHEALIPMKELLGEKKYTNRIRKAVKIITEGIEKKKKHTELRASEKEGKKITAADQKTSGAAAAKKPVVKKAIAPVKKAATKKAEVKKAAPAKSAPAQKAQAVKKAVSKSK
jgi:hypothetical protein